MKLKPTLGAWLGALLFVTGVLIGLALSASVTWAQTEAFLYTSYTSDARLGMKCPLMLSPGESGLVSSKIVNFTDETIMPLLSAEISHGTSPRRLDQTASIKPHESGTVEWAVNSSDVVFEGLIVVSILQSRYHDNPSFLGSCGVLLFSLFNLTGMQTLSLVMFSSLAALVSGGALWWRARQPLDGSLVNFARINAVLMAITILALLSALLRWWGLTLFLDALILLMLGIIFTDFVLFQSSYMN